MENLENLGLVAGDHVDVLVTYCVVNNVASGNVSGCPGANNQAQLEAGKYVLRNVYIGAKQGLSNAPQAEVQVDLTKNLKATATIATGSSATVTQGAQQQDPGTSAGLSWQFEY